MGKKKTGPVREGTRLSVQRRPVGESATRVTPCFTPGTNIATPRGQCAVELLKAGDKIITRDNGIQQINWAGRTGFDGRELAEDPHLQPVLIQQGALGDGLPEHDMRVSPNHRILVSSDRTALYFEEREVLVAAKHLINHRGIQTLQTTGTIYVHFMCTRHEVVMANGCWTESFQPADNSLKGIGNAQRNELLEMFPHLRKHLGATGFPAARRILSPEEARWLAD